MSDLADVIRAAGSKKWEEENECLNEDEMIAIANDHIAAVLDAEEAKWPHSWVQGLEVVGPEVRTIRYLRVSLLGKEKTDG